MTPIDIKGYLEAINQDAIIYEKMALDLFDKAITCKSKDTHKQQLYEHIVNPEKKIDIWALSTKCVTYPKPLDIYMIGNGNGNANQMIQDIMRRTQNERLPSLHRQLLYAACQQNKKAVRAIIKIGEINVNYQDDASGFTALHIAVMNKAGSRFINFLIGLGADVSIKDSVAGRTPIHYAVQSMRQDVIAIILGPAGPEQMNVRDNDGISPLGVCYSQLESPNAEVIEKILVEHGAKYSLLRPFLQQLESLIGAKNFSSVTNKVYASIEQDMIIVQQENLLLKNSLVDVVEQNTNLTKVIDELNEKHKQQIDSLYETAVSQRDVDLSIYKNKISEYTHQIGVQEQIIKMLSNQINECCNCEGYQQFRYLV
jgi:ankyrin repeat protein